MNMKKVMTLALAMALLVTVAVAGTVAWLMDTTDPVVNTFSPAEIEITLEETLNTDSNNDGTNDAWTAQLVPGKEYAKDPIVSVVDNETDIDCYLFVRMEKVGNPDKYLDYTSLLDGNGWNQVPNTTDVWYRVVGNNDATQSWKLLDGDKVTVKSTLVETDMPAEGTEVKLIYEAYAIQTVGFEDNVAGAWAAAYAQKTTATNP